MNHLSINTELTSKWLLSEHEIVKEQCSLLKDSVHFTSGITKDDFRLYLTGKFLELINDRSESSNPYNDKSFKGRIREFKILDSKFYKTYGAFKEVNGQVLLANRRSHVREVVKIIDKHIVFMLLLGTERVTPILVDKNYHVIDGYQRLVASKVIGYPIHVVRLDYME